jgi:hypothetical protein
MTKPLSFQNTTKRAKSTERRSGGARRELVRVPALDWPTKLFNDDANLAELKAEEFELQWGPAAMAWGHQSPEMYILAAA